MSTAVTPKCAAVTSDLKAIDALCIHFDLDVLDVIDAASEMPERHWRNADLQIYARLAVIDDFGWLSEGILLGLYADYIDYHEIETME